MYRFLLLLLALPACTTPVARESRTFDPSLSLSYYGLIAGYQIDVGINAPGRDLETSVSVDVGGFLPDNAWTAVELYDSGSSLLASDEADDIYTTSTASHTLAFGPCRAEDGYVETKDGGCGTTLYAVAYYDDFHLTASVEIEAVTYPPSGWDGDPDSVVLTLDVTD